MPKLRRLSGKEIVKILESMGFVVVRVRGSHHILRRIVVTSTRTRCIHIFTLTECILSNDQL